MKKKHIYFIGIKGVGMTALAIYCKERGDIVSGSDTDEKFQTDKILKNFNIPIKIGFFENNIRPNINQVIYSGAYDVEKNPETKNAKKLKIPLISHGEALGKYMSEQDGISVAGTHGKTTSTAMLAKILVDQKMDPSYIIGCAEVNGLLASGHYGKGQYFIAEADEYQTAVNKIKKSRFLWQNPKYAIITNVDYDHPDVFSNIDEVKTAFLRLIQKVPRNGVLVYNGDDHNLKEITVQAKCNLVSFGEGKNNNYRVEDFNIKGGKTEFTLVSPKDKIKIKTSLFGKHNSLNIAGVYVLAMSLGVNKNKLVDSIENFKGTKRRLELIKSKNGIDYYDDYAHHPAEIQSTLWGVKSKFPNRRLIVIFQPHTYSRTQALLSRFCSSFSMANKLILTDIFSSAREKKDSFKISGEHFYQKIKKFQVNTVYAKNQAQMIQYLKKVTRVGDIVLTMGAGDIYKLHEFL